MTPAGASTQGLSITSVGPSPSAAGATVVVTGNDLSAVTAVAVHGVAAAFSVVSPTRIRATVPSRATTGYVTVTAGTGSATSPTVLPLVSTVTSFSPTSGGVGTGVTITGTGFTSPCTLSFNGTPAGTCLVRSPTTIVTFVPARASTGKISVTSAGSTETTTTDFTVTLGLLLSPTTGTPSSVVSVDGSGFAANEAVDLYFGTTDQALVATDGNGNFVDSAFGIPASAPPGTSWISAVGRRSGLATQGAFNVNTNWNERGFGPAHRGVNPYENTLNPADVGSIGQQWSFGTGSAVFSSPAVVNGTVYVGSEDDSVYAVSAITGTRQWSYATGAPVISSPAVANGLVYVGSEDNSVYALNAATGGRQWSRATGGIIISSPAVANGTVYVASSDGNVYALNAATGASVWTFATGNPANSSPAVANGVVYVGAGDNLLALSAATGAELWSYSTGWLIESSPAVANGTVYVGSDNGNVYAVNAVSGALRWIFSTTGVVFGAPAVANGTVYVGSQDGDLYALNGATGALVWTFVTGGSVYSSAAVANGVVYVGGVDGNLYALDAGTGTELWSSATGSLVQSSPAVANGAVYVGSNDDSVYAFSQAGGRSAAGRAHPVDPASLRPDRTLKVSA